jgi:hypothetical protein
LGDVLLAERPAPAGLGALFQKLIDPRIHWNSRYEAFAIGGIIFVAAWRECYLARHSIPECDALTHFQILNPKTTQPQEKLDFLEHNHLNLYAKAPNSGPR